MNVRQESVVPDFEEPANGYYATKHQRFFFLGILRSKDLRDFWIKVSEWVVFFFLNIFLRSMALQFVKK